MAKSKSTEVATRADTNLPAFMQGYKGPLGTENIDDKDVAIPRLKLAQSLTPQVKDGLMEEGSLFLNVTGEVVWKPGDAPLEVVPLVQGKEYILWKDRKDGGGILARAKPVRDKGVTRYRWDKPNTEFQNKVGGKTLVKWKTKDYIDQDGLDQWGSEIPNNKDSGIAATAHHNYVVALPGHGNIIAAVSLSKSGVKKAKDFNAALKMGQGAPIFGRVFELTSVQETNAAGERYCNYAFKPKGLVQDAEAFKQYAGFAKGFVDSGFTVDQSDGGDSSDTDDRV